MTAPLCFTVPGVPMGKQRPRFARVGKFTRAYTPKETVSYESLIRHSFAVAFPKHAPIDGPVCLRVRSYHPIPKSTSKKRRVEMLREGVPFGHKSDADNILKIFGDALNEVAWRDDALITDAHIIKRYSDRPRVEILISQIGTEGK